MSLLHTVTGIAYHMIEKDDTSNYSKLVAIVSATYTFYYVITAVISEVSFRKRDNAILAATKTEYLRGGTFDVYLADSHDTHLWLFGKQLFTNDESHYVSRSHGHYAVERLVHEYQGAKENQTAEITMIHILVVDDDKDRNRLVCSYLNDSGFETMGCLSVNEAYDEMYSNLYAS